MNNNTNIIDRTKVYGWVNNKPVYSRDEFIFESRHHGPIETDAELLAFAQKVTHNWFNAGWHRTFETFYLSDYACGEPYQSLTKTEFARLKELQKEAIKAHEEAEKAREWRLIEHVCWADNSEEDIYEDKDGNRKTVMTVGPHGDACY